MQHFGPKLQNGIISCPNNCIAHCPGQPNSFHCCSCYANRTTFTTTQKPTTAPPTIPTTQTTTPSTTTPSTTTPSTTTTTTTTTTTPPTTHPPPPTTSCFPSIAKVKLQNGKSITMSELQIGDQVQTGVYKFDINIFGMVSVVYSR